MIKQPIVLPPNRTWSQPNTGNLFGSIYSSRNLNTEVPGIVSIARRGLVVYQENTSGSNFDHVIAIVYGQFGATMSGGSSTNQYIVVTDDELFMLFGSLSNMGQLTNASTPSMSDNSDGVAWNDGFYCTTGTNLSKLVSGTWTNSLFSLTSGQPHPLCVSASGNYLLIGNGQELKKRTIAGVNTTALTIPSNYQIVWIRSDYTRTLIGTRTLDGTNCAVFEWDEVAPTWTNKYDVDTPEVLSGCFRNTDFFVVTADGRLLKYNGGGFSYAAQWPIYKVLQGYLNSSDNPISKPVYQRGMTVVNGRLTININGDIDQGQYGSPLYENFPSGIYDYDEASGLSHAFGAVVTTTDFSQMVYGVGAGAVAQVVWESSPPTADTDGSYFLSGSRMSDGVNDFYTLFTVIEGANNVAQLTTTRIETSDIADDAKKIWCKYRGVFTADDSIRFKFKDKWLNGLPFSTASNVTWTSSTVFTSADTNFANVLTAGSDGGKYEVTVLSGEGAGSMRHISSITYANPTYTVTLSEAVTGISASDVGQVSVDNFELLEESITYTDTSGYKSISIPQDDPRTWIQVKVEMRGSENVTIEELQLVPASDIIATA